VNVARLTRGLGQGFLGVYSEEALDPALQPINGISLEQYAELGAAITDVPGETEQLRIVQTHGVSAQDWQAAKAGWTARMQDMALMGRVAMAYMPLYQAALAKRNGGVASCSYEDFVGVSAAIKVFGWEAALNACGVTQGEWTEVAGGWTSQMQREMQRFAGHSQYVAQEEQRLRSGGAPRRPQITRGAGLPVATAQPPVQYQQPATGMDVAMAQAMNNPALLHAQQAQAAIAENPLGFAFGQAKAALTGGIMAGSRVAVLWSDGNQYLASVMQSAPGQFLVQFDNGSQQWVPEHAVRQA
jgi:hypothetical protein